MQIEIPEKMVDDFKQELIANHMLKKIEKKQAFLQAIIDCLDNVAGDIRHKCRFNGIYSGRKSFELSEFIEKEVLRKLNASNA